MKKQNLKSKLKSHKRNQKGGCGCNAPFFNGGKKLSNHTKKSHKKRKLTKKRKWRLKKGGCNCGSSLFMNGGSGQGFSFASTSNLDVPKIPMNSYVSDPQGMQLSSRLDPITQYTPRMMGGKYNRNRKERGQRGGSNFLDSAFNLNNYGLSSNNPNIPMTNGMLNSVNPGLSALTGNQSVSSNIIPANNLDVVNNPLV